MAVTPTGLGKPKCDAKGANTRKNTFAERVVLGCTLLIRLWITLFIFIKGGSFTECQSSGSLVQQSLNERVESKNDFKKTTENCITCSKRCL